MVVSYNRCPCNIKYKAVDFLLSDCATKSGPNIPFTFICGLRHIRENTHAGYFLISQVTHAQRAQVKIVFTNVMFVLAIEHIRLNDTLG